jgi:SAM-dependent methyltransferase
MIMIVQQLRLPLLVRCLGLSAVAWWLGAGLGLASDVPYVPTHQSTVVEMLTLAGVGEGDVVYDLGSGDGRFVITAAQMGARGIGIEIDPERIRESKANATAAGVGDRVRFIEQDLFEANISEATVVTMYLLPEVNIRLRPKLLAELRPGTRVVSNYFSMGAWQPDREIRNGRTIYFWIIPANLTGTWIWSGTDGTRYTMEVTQDFQKISGHISSGPSTMEISEGKVTGDQVTIIAERRRTGTGEKITFRGRIDGETITGSAERAEGSFSWQATREQGTQRRLDDGSRVVLHRQFH